MTERWHDTVVAVARKKTTVYLDPDLLRALKVMAASSGRHEYEVIEDALRRYLSTPQAGTSRQALRELLSQLDTHAELSDEEALDLAYAELHAARREHRRE
jgi:predicted transcriptional regulator